MKFGASKKGEWFPRRGKIDDIFLSNGFDAVTSVPVLVTDLLAT